MPGIVHLLIGAVLGIIIQDTPTMFVVAFFSHYLLDFIPHIDPATFAAKSHPFSPLQKLGITIDIVLVLSLMYALFLVRGAGPHVLLGVLAAQLPDLLTPLEEYHIFSPLKRIHEMFHWDTRRAKYWDWYIVGLINPIILSVVCLILIAKFV